jgi:hypothetical protein
MQPTSIKTAGNHYGEWKSSLGFYKDELTIFKNRLTEIVSKNNSKEIMKTVEHFENQFLLQSENIDILQHDIGAHLNAMAGEIKEHAGHISSGQLAEEAQLKDRFESESKVYKELRDEFMQFLEKVM